MLFEKSVFYITPDFFRAIGLEKVLPDYHIICIEDHPLIDLLKDRGIKIFSLERETGAKNVFFRNTGKILEHPLVEEYIRKNSKTTPHILYFKPSSKIDLICQKRGYFKLGNNEKLNLTFEDKVSFFRMCQSLGIPLAKGEINFLKNCRYEDLVTQYGKDLVIQFGRGWAGSTTYFVKNKEEFQGLQGKLPEKEVRITRFINGKTLLNNVCITKKSILMSPPAEQVTAPLGFTSKPGSTCGRQWPAKIKSPIRKKIEIYTKLVGGAMRDLGYKGYFGLDFLVEEGTENVYISENNARLTASVPMFTKLELRLGHTPLLLYHIFEFANVLNEVDESTKDAELIGSELVIRNDLSSPVQISNNVPSGIYKNADQVREGYSLDDIDNQDEYFVLISQKGKIINPEVELVKINCLEEVLDEQGEIAPGVKKTLFDLKSKLELKPYGNL